MKNGLMTTEFWWSVIAFFTPIVMIWFEKIIPQDIPAMIPLFMLVPGYQVGRVIEKLKSKVISDKEE